MERLSTLDASFLRVETPSAHMHVGWLAEVELPEGSAGLDAAGLRRRIAGKLHLTPRFRQRLRDAPIGDPFWADDSAFDLRAHVRATPAAASEADLARIRDDFLSTPLDHSRPLWQIAVVPSAPRGRAAILGKVHHAMVDGIAAVGLGILLFDLEPDPDSPIPPPWDPRPEASPVRVAAEAVADSAVEQFRAARTAAATGLRPGQAWRTANSVRRAAFSLAGDMARPMPDTFLHASLSPRRTLVCPRIDLAHAKDVAASAGVKLNDVVLAIVAGALRDLSGQLGETAQPQRTMVPISVRGEGEEDAGGNRITFGFIDLPCDVAGPEERLRGCARQMNELKLSSFAAASDTLMKSVRMLPGPIKAGVAKAAASPRTYTVTVSNVPGPTVELYAAGARVSAVHPVIPITEGHCLSIGVLSYGGTLHFGVYADPAALPQVARLGESLPAALDELEADLSPGPDGGTEPAPELASEPVAVEFPQRKSTEERRRWPAPRPPRQAQRRTRTAPTGARPREQRPAGSESMF